MIVFLLFTTSFALNLTNFANFEIEFDAECNEYFLLEGHDDYMYFYQKNGQFELWVIQNITNYAIYTMPWSDRIIFQWPDKIINNKSMEMILYDGEIQYPLDFKTETLLCTVYGISAGSLYFDELPELHLFKCLEHKGWVQDFLISMIIVLFLMIIGVKHEFVRTVFGSKVSRLIWGCRQVLSGSQKTSSQGDTEHYSEVSKVSEAIYIA